MLMLQYFFLFLHRCAEMLLPSLRPMLRTLSALKYNAPLRDGEVKSVGYGLLRHPYEALRTHLVDFSAI